MAQAQTVKELRTKLSATEAMAEKLAEAIDKLSKGVVQWRGNCLKLAIKAQADWQRFKEGRE